MATRHDFAARRRALGLSQQDLADRVGVDRSTVARCERGEATPRGWYRRLYAEVLEVSLDELDRLLEMPPAAIEPSPSAAPSHGDVVILDLPGAGDPAPARAADADYVEGLRRQAADLVTLDTQYGGDDVVRVAVRAFRAAYRRAASGLYLPEVERDLHAAAGELAQVASWAAYDAEQQPLARKLVHEAMLASRLAGDRSMELFELGTLAMQSIHVGHGAEALRIAEDVLDANRLSGRTEALFHVRRARALAMAGHHRRSLNALDRASALVHVGTTNRDPSWTWWLDDSELAWHRAMILAAIGDWRSAVEFFHRAFDGRPVDAPRGRYNDLAHLADAQTSAGAWTDAEATLTELAVYSDDIRSTRTKILVLQVIDRVVRSRAAGPSSTLVDLATGLRHHTAEAF